MARVKRTRAMVPDRKRRIRQAGLKVSLPTAYEEPGGTLDEFSFLIHGEKKIGKTTLALESGNSKDKVLVLQCDPPQRAYRRLEILVPDWRTFLAALKRLEAAVELGKYPYCRVVVDRVDLLYRHCFQHVCDANGMEHPQDAAWGRGYDAIRKEFSGAMGRLLRLPGGRWFLCHSAWRDIETRDGDETTKLLPSLPKQAEEILNGQVDCWFAYDYTRRGRRILILLGDERTGAGHRLDRDVPHFRDVDGDPLRQIDAGKSSRQAFKNLLAAFNNKYSVKPKARQRGARVRK